MNDMQKRERVLDRMFHPTLSPFGELIPKSARLHDDEGTEEIAPPNTQLDEDFDILKSDLKKRGYDPDEFEEEVREVLRSGVARGGKIVTKKTGKVQMDRGIPEEPPGFVRPDSLKIGDTVQAINWYPLGTRGAVIDLYPEGKVTKMYFTKCLVTKEACPLGFIPEDEDLVEEDRLIGLELDGKGPFALKAKGMRSTPFVIKDSSIILRFPTMAAPDGQSRHVSPGTM